MQVLWRQTVCFRDSHMSHQQKMHLAENIWNQSNVVPVSYIVKNLKKKTAKPVLLPMQNCAKADSIMGKVTLTLISWKWGSWSSIFDFGKTSMRIKMISILWYKHHLWWHIVLYIENGTLNIFHWWMENSWGNIWRSFNRFMISFRVLF